MPLSAFAKGMSFKHARAAARFGCCQSGYLLLIKMA
jgi:hypothetical protein